MRYNNNNHIKSDQGIVMFGKISLMFVKIFSFESKLLLPQGANDWKTIKNNSIIYNDR
jgi:hypothetical protein